MALRAKWARCRRDVAEEAAAVSALENELKGQAQRTPQSRFAVRVRALRQGRLREHCTGRFGVSPGASGFLHQAHRELRGFTRRLGVSPGASGLRQSTLPPSPSLPCRSEGV